MLVNRWYQSWLRRRNPPKKTQVLNRKNIFIFPSRLGFCFLATVGLLWLLGTNYQNNLVLVMSFLLLSLLHTCIFYTYGNVSSLTVSFKKVTPCFAGEAAQVELTLHHSSRSTKKVHHQIQLHWMSSDDVITIDIPSHTDASLSHSSQTITLPWITLQRGMNRVERLTISTHYPLGLLRAWSHSDLDIQCMVYPAPIATILPVNRVMVLDNNEQEDDENIDELDNVITTQDNIVAETTNDVSHLRDYENGDSLRHIAWKHFAKGQGLASKVFENENPLEQQQWLHWDDFAGLPTEARLSHLCDCVLQAEEHQLLYGLVLPTMTFPLGQGELHKYTLLEALALFNAPTHNKDIGH